MATCVGDTAGPANCSHRTRFIGQLGVWPEPRPFDLKAPRLNPLYLQVTASTGFVPLRRASTSRLALAVYKSCRPWVNCGFMASLGTQTPRTAAATASSSTNASPQSTPTGCGFCGEHDVRQHLNELDSSGPNESETGLLVGAIGVASPMTLMTGCDRRFRPRQARSCSYRSSWCLASHWAASGRPRNDC